MIHEVIPVGPLQCNCSIVGDPVTHEAIIIDPGAEADRILKIMAGQNLTAKLIVITHGHIDHVGGAMKLKQRTGAPILMNRNDDGLLRMLDVQASWLGLQVPGPVDIDSDIEADSHIKAGNIDALVLHTPGHTEGSICLLFSAENTLIAGDTLFAGGIGRTDLPGGSYEKILSSLQQYIIPMSDDILVVPGHGPLTTIGKERQYNPFLAHSLGHNSSNG